jgi:hypothetical protein
MILIWFNIAAWYYNIDKLSLLAYKVTQLGGTEEVRCGRFFHLIYFGIIQGIYK